jgi:sigma-B regulation protein RsbU (phosphoserine phosphatase)
MMNMSLAKGFRDGSGAWQDRMALIVETMRELSLQTDPQAMVGAYGKKIAQILPVDGRVSLSRRGLEPPKYRITRSSAWKQEINPWKQKDRLPLLEGGILGELLYGDEPRIIDNLEIAPDDPAAEFLAGHRSLMAIPMYDKGIAINMVVLMRKEPAAFPREEFPEWVWLSNLFGRAAHTLVLAEELQEAYEEVDRELKLVADIQRSLLPAELPTIPTMDLAAYYQTSKRAGGDYYDFFPLSGGKWGILLADVSGHGTPAAVFMAITHSIAHTYPGSPIPPGVLLNYVNHHLATRYAATSETFVTAFYGIYDSTKRELHYACAGHNAPRLKRCQTGAITSLDGVLGIPLGISAEERYEDVVQVLQTGDQIAFYTDGITEANNPAGEMFGLDRLDRVLEECSLVASALLDEVLRAVEKFTEGRAADDDRTLIVARIS